MKEALLVLDMLNDFVLKGAPLEVPDTRKILPVVKKEIDQARAAGNPVIFVCDAHAPDDREFSKFGWPAHAVSGTAGARVVDELKPAGEDIIITKTTYTGFFGTVTHICVMFTAMEAVLRDYRVTVVEDGVAGISREDHDAALRIIKNVLGAAVVKSGAPAAGRKAA
jgi:nicotinamidase-related amidase